MISETRTNAVKAVEATASVVESSGGIPRGHTKEAQASKAKAEETRRATEALMEAVVERGNMNAAYKRVVRNKGAAGIDGMEVSELKSHLQGNWARIRKELLGGVYKPQEVRGVEIPKPAGGMRQLGIPTAVDRLIQQALSQVLTPIFDPGFSESSYGFRPGRSAHQAVLKARSYAPEGRRWVVDMDLEKFFDRVNHDILTERVSRKVGDKRVLQLIRGFLQAGLMKGGLTTQRTEGTPQGGPLSPLLSNIMLDDLDKELERRGHRFCRYADDCNIYVKSKAAGERVLESIGSYLSKRLKLRLNREKSKVGRPWRSKFLGYSMTMERVNPRLKVSQESERRLRAALKEKFRQGRGRTIQRVIEEINPKLSGWGSYFKLSEVKRAFEELDSWIRRRLRALLWRQWRKPKAIKRNLAGRGLSVERSRKSAWNGRGSWWNSGASHMNEAFPKSYFDSLKLVSLQDIVLRNAQGLQ